MGRIKLLSSTKNFTRENNKKDMETNNKDNLNKQLLGEQDLPAIV